MPIPGVAQATAYDADTGAVIAEQDLPKALAEGRAAFKQGSRVHLLDSSGKHISVDAADVGTSLKQGYQLLSNEGLAARAAAKQRAAEGREAFNPLNPLDTYVSYQEAFHRGGTFGLSDVVLNKALGDDYTKRAAARQREDKLSGVNETIGLGAGIVAGALSGGATAGAGAASRGLLGALTGGSRLAAGAGRLGVSGLRTLGVTGESLAGRAALKGVEYGLAGGVEGGLMGAGKYASDATLANEKITAEKLASAAGTGALWGAATGGVMGTGGTLLGPAARKIFQGLGSGKPLQELASDYAEKRALKAAIGNSKKHWDEALSRGIEGRVGRRLLDDAVPLQSLPKAQTAVTARLNEAGGQMRAIAQGMDDAGVKINGRAVMDAVDEQVAKIKETPFGTSQRVAKTIEKEIAPLRAKIDAGEEFSVTEFWDFKQRLGKNAFKHKRSQSLATEEMQSLYGNFSDNLTLAIEQADPAAGKAWRAAAEKYSDYKLVEQGLEEIVKRREANRTVSPTDYLTGTATALGSLASGGGAILSMAKGATVSALHKQLRERGPAYVAYAADALAKLETRQAAAVAAIADGSLLGKATNLAASAEAAKQSVREDFLARRKAIDLLQQDPAAAAQRLRHATAGVTEADPQMGAELTQLAVADAQYLAGHLPSPLSRAGYSFTPQAEDADRYPETAMQQWLKRARALDDPMSVVEDLARGELNREGIEALKERRPEMFRQLQVKVMTSLAEAKEPISYNRRVLLSLAFDFPGDKSLTPGYAKNIQAAFQSPEGQAPQQPPQPGAAPPPEYAASLRL